MAKADCKRCGGTGWIVSAQDGTSFADRCACVDEKLSEEKTRRAQIPEKFAQATFDTLKFPSDNPMAERDLKTASVQVRGYSRDFPKTPKPGLLLFGKTGTGKTHMAVAVLRELISRGHEGIFFHYQTLLERIYAGYNKTLGTSDVSAYESALETEILLIDDLGAHSINDWVEDTVTSIVTHRYNHRKPMIITTNLSDPEIGGSLIKNTLEERVGPRVRSRLFEMCTVVKLANVDDYRVHPFR